MQLGTFFKVHAVIALLFGIGFIFMPATILSFYTTVPVNEVGVFMSRLFGSAILTYAAVLWLASDTADSPARRAIPGFLHYNGYWCGGYFAFSTYWPD